MRKNKLIYLLTLNFDPFADGRAKYVAASKATEDVRKILFKNFSIKEKVLRRRFRNKLIGPIEFILKFCFLCLSIPRRSVVFVQYPMVNISAFVKVVYLLKRFTSIAIIHDLQSYRYPSKNKIHDEVTILNSFSEIIVHTEAMRAKIENDGVKKKIHVLDCFDYLLDNFQECQKADGTIVYAGSLIKSIFLKDLHKINPHMKYNLYGVPKPEIVFTDNVIYKGAFSPNDISVIEGDWGLLWDGDSVETCSGNFGDYLQLIAPHKFSLYLACGLKIICWEYSAMAAFVKEKKIGITIMSLNEIEGKMRQLSFSDIHEIEQNVNAISKEVRTGYFFKTAMNKVLCDINN